MADMHFMSHSFLLNSESVLPISFFHIKKKSTVVSICAEEPCEVFWQTIKRIL